MKVNYEIAGTTNSPKILFDPINLIFLVEGESRPKDVDEFYSPVIDWLTDYSNRLKGSKEAVEGTLKLNLEFANSASIMMLLKIVKIFDEIATTCEDVIFEIHWHYSSSDDDGFELGQELEELAGLQFQFIKY